MNKGTKRWLIAAAILVLIGCMILGGAWIMMKRGFSTQKYKTNTQVISEAFRSLSIETDTADIILAPSQDGTCSVVCYENEKAPHWVTVENGTLTIQLQDRRSWLDHISFSFHTPKITVYLPEGTYETLSVNGSTGDIQIPKSFSFSDAHISLSTGNIDWLASASGAVKLKTGTGSIRADSFQAGALDVSVTTGKVDLSNVTCAGDVTVQVSTGKANIDSLQCQSLSSQGSTGDLTMANVIAKQNFSLEHSTGDIKLDRCDAAELTIKTNTGDVSGTLLSEKVFLTKTDTGDIQVPQTTAGGKCQVQTSTGDIDLEIQA